MNKYLVRWKLLFVVMKPSLNYVNYIKISKTFLEWLFEAKDDITFTRINLNSITKYSNYHNNQISKFLLNFQFNKWDNHIPWKYVYIKL